MTEVDEGAPGTQMMPGSNPLERLGRTADPGHPCPSTSDPVNYNNLLLSDYGTRVHSAEGQWEALKAQGRRQQNEVLDNVEAVVAPWVVPDYSPPPRATPKAKAYAAQVATMLQKQDLLPSEPSSSNFVPIGDLGPGLSSISPPPGDLGSWENRIVPDYVVTNGFREWIDQSSSSSSKAPQPSRQVPQVVSRPLIDKARKESISEFENEGKAAFDKGVFQTDTSDHARYKKVDPESLKGGTTVLEPKPGMRTMRMAYFFCSEPSARPRQPST